jgi:hypothetical protein
MVSDPPIVPLASVIVKGVLPPASMVARLNVALNGPESEIPPVKVAVPEATYEVPELELASVALTVKLTFKVAASAAAQTSKAVTNRSILSPP